MIRPRDGDDFQYDADELEVMERDVILLKESGASGFVFGCLNSEGEIDVEACSRLLRVAQPLPCTFPRFYLITFLLEIFILKVIVFLLRLVRLT